MRSRWYTVQNKGITLRLKIAFVQPPGREGEFSWEFLVEVCPSVLQILTSTAFQTKSFHFPHTFSDLTSKIHTRFRLGGGHKTRHSSILWQKLCNYYSDLNAKFFFFSLRIRIIPFGIPFAFFCFLKTFGHQNAQRHYALMHNSFQYFLHTLLVRDFRKSTHLNAI